MGSSLLDTGHLQDSLESVVKVVYCFGAIIDHPHALFSLLLDEAESIRPLMP